MKQKMVLTGQVELSRTEITEKLRDWLAKEHQLDLTKAVYFTEGNAVKSVVIDVIKRQEDNTMITLDSRQEMAVTPVRKRYKKYERRNKGIFPALRRFFEFEKSKRTKEINFEALLNLTKMEFPNITKRHLSMYLYDHRQLPGIVFDSKAGVIRLE